MSNDRDDEALSWAGEDDPTLVAKSRDASARPVAPGASDGLAEAAGRSRTDDRIGVDSDIEGSDTADSDEDGVVDDGLPPQTSSVLLVALGVLGGVYLLFTIGWVAAVQRLAGVFAFTDPVAQWMFVLGEWLAMASPVVWFFATIWLTPGSVRARVLWLLLGVPLLAPWPFILGLGAV